MESKRHDTKDKLPTLTLSSLFFGWLPTVIQSLFYWFLHNETSILNLALKAFG